MADVGQLVRTIPWKEITLGEKLGEGGFGIVYRGTWKHMREEVAIKKIKGEIGADAEAELKREAEITKRLDSPYIIRLWGLCWEKHNYSMVMELMPKASLYHLLHAGQPLPWNVRYSIAQDIAYGLRLLHENKILHRDLKSLNVLLDDRLRAKLADFGLAKVKTQSRTTSKDSGGSVGTLAWMAPELFEGESCTEKTDLYAYGMTAWEIASQETPFSQVANPHIIPVLVGKNKRPETPADCPQGFTALIQKCWSQEPNERPNLDYVVNVLEQITSSAPPAPAPALLYQDGSLDSLGVVTNARPQPQDAELLKEMAQLRLDKQKAEQEKANMAREKQALEQKLAQQMAAAAARPAAPPPPPPKPMLPQAAAAAKPVAPPQEQKIAPVPQSAAAPRIAPAEVAAFLQQIAAGQQDEAEASLRRNASLALASGDVTDHANRTFRNITGFQYAVWALDWHMWKMILKYLPQDSATAQARIVETGLWVRQHGVSVSWENLSDAIKHYISKFESWSEDQRKAYWRKEVGGAQLLLPIHVFNEYCRADRSFEPCPDFIEERLPRTMKIDDGSDMRYDRLAKDFALQRDGRIGSGWRGYFVHREAGANMTGLKGGKLDCVAIKKLMSVRSEQRKALLSALSRRDRMGGPRT